MTVRNSAGDHPVALPGRALDHIPDHTDGLLRQCSLTGCTSWTKVHIALSTRQTASLRRVPVPSHQEYLDRCSLLPWDNTSQHYPTLQNQVAGSVCVCACVRMHVCVCMYACACLYVCMSVCMCACVCVHVCMHVYVCVHVCVYVGMRMCVPAVVNAKVKRTWYYIILVVGRAQ